MGEEELLEYLKNELGFIIGEQVLGCFYHANGKFEVGVKSDAVKKRIVEKITSGRINKEGKKHSDILDTEDFVPASSLVYLHRVPHNFPKEDLINCIEHTFQTKVLFTRIKYHNNFPGVTNGIRSFAIDTIALLKLKDSAPDGVTINNNRFYLTFKGMVKKCFKCGAAGHVKKDCERLSTGRIDQSLDPTGDSREGNEEREQEAEEKVSEDSAKTTEGAEEKQLVESLRTPSDPTGGLSGGENETQDANPPTLILTQRLDTEALKTGECDTGSPSTHNQQNPPSSQQHSSQNTPLAYSQLEESPSKYFTPPSRMKNHKAVIESFNQTSPKRNPTTSLFPPSVTSIIEDFRRKSSTTKNNPLDPQAFPEIQDEDREVTYHNTNLSKKTSASISILNTPNDDQFPKQTFPLRRKSLSPKLRKTWSDPPPQPILPHSPPPPVLPNSLLESVTQSFKNGGSAIMSSLKSSSKRPRNSLSPNNSQPTTRPKMAPCVVEEPLNETERWERLSTLRPTQPPKKQVSNTLKCLTCKGTLVVEQNTHKLVYTFCEKDIVLIIPCSTPGCKWWLPPTLRSGARRTCVSCYHIYYRCACRQLHVVPASDVRYRCKDCNEQVCDYPCREP